MLHIGNLIMIYTVENATYFFDDSDLIVDPVLLCMLASALESFYNMCYQPDNVPEQLIYILETV